MLERYSTKELKEIWTDKNKYESWLLVELYATEAYLKVNKVITKKDVENTWKKAKEWVDVDLLKKKDKMDLEKKKCIPLSNVRKPKNYNK